LHWSFDRPRNWRLTFADVALLYSKARHDQTARQPVPKGCNSGALWGSTGRKFAGSFAHFGKTWHGRLCGSRYFHLPPDGTHEGGGSDDAPNATPRAGAASSMLFVPVGGFRLILNRMPEPLHNEFRNLARSAAQSRNVERKPCTAVSRGPPCPIHTWPGGPMAKRCAGIACGSAVVPYKIPDLWDRAAA
jgi:hypothetical protein